MRRRWISPSHVETVPMKRMTLQTLVGITLLCLSILAPNSILAQRGPRGGRRDHSATSSSITMIEPTPDSSETSRPLANIAARIAPGIATEASIGGTTVPIFATGVFVRDNIPLQMGANSFSIQVDAGGSTPLEHTVQITRVPEESKTLTAPASAAALAIDPKSIVPTENVALLPGDDLEVSFKGTPGNTADFQLSGGNWTPMPEVLDAGTTNATGLYRATIRVAAPPNVTGTDASTSQPILLRLRAKQTSGDSQDSSSAGAPLLMQSKARVLVLPESGPPQLVRVKDNEIGHLAYGLTEVRLGGPYLSELTSGTILRVIGRRGFNLKVQLSPDQTAWIPAYEVEPAAPGTAVPHLEFTDMNTSITTEGDEALIIPYDSPIPFAVRDVVSQEEGGSPSLTVDLYGAHNACTWITHRRPGKIIRQVTLDQVSTDHLRVTANLHGKRIWGYKWEVTTGTLKVTLRHAPGLQANASSPLAGLTVAVEAGHGGSNQGATGVTGSREKDITLAVSKAVEDQLTAAGALVVQTRIGDESIGLSKRAQRAMEASADLFVSIHCNSSGTNRGYLGTAGNALFYKHPFNHELANSVHQHILEHTGLPPFGVVGNFNYAPVRVLTWMPAILVEQAFISNPQEEAKLLDPVFQKKMAEGIRTGLEDWLKAE